MTSKVIVRADESNEQTLTVSNSGQQTQQLQAGDEQTFDVQQGQTITIVETAVQQDQGGGASGAQQGRQGAGSQQSRQR
jgi:hypothetical protein